MLTEDDRDYITDTIYGDITFTYDGFTPKVDIFRHGEGIEIENPYILAEFLPANRSKFRSISDVIGNAEDSPNGQYRQYGFCQLEHLSLYCYSGEFHNNYRVNGRKLTYALAETLLIYLQRNLEGILWGLDATLDRADNLWYIKDSSYYDENKGSKVYCYSIEVYIRTQMQWNKVPPNFGGEEICEQAGVYLKSTGEDEYTL